MSVFLPVGTGVSPVVRVIHPFLFFFRCLKGGTGVTPVNPRKTLQKIGNGSRSVPFRDMVRLVLGLVEVYGLMLGDNA